MSTATPDDAVALLASLRGEVRQHHPGGRITLAVDGTSGAGITAFADALAEVLREDGSAVFRASAADFSDASGATDAAALRGLTLTPFRAGEPFRTRASGDEEAAAPASAVLLVDGRFLLGPELRGAWNWSVWLDAPRDAADEAYLREANPRNFASALVENSDPAHPVREFWDFC